MTRIIFSGNATDGSGLNATAVEWTATGDGTKGARKQVNVNKEVILAGGSIGSPHVLMHSGVGPADVLKKAGVTLRTLCLFSFLFFVFCFSVLASLVL